MTIEKEIRRARNPKGILVPLIMNMMANVPVGIESPEDVKFITDLITSMMQREEARKEDGLGYYSPSSLGERCTRKSFFSRHAIRNPEAPSPYGLTAHYYFLTGNFIHIKWQFTLYKLERYIGNANLFRNYGYEIPLTSKRGDHRGTIDQIVFIRDEPFVLDYKGLNVFSAKKVKLGNVPVQYRTQVADYLVLWNSQRPCPFRIEKALLIVEDKGGGENFLHESLITLERDGARARRRLAELRAHEQAGTTPPPSCKSLKDRAFLQCQYRGICHDEVAAVGRKNTARIRAKLDKTGPTTQERVLKALKTRR